MRAAWAEHFNLPRTDPRYLDASDDDVVFDLLVLQYRAGERRRSDPMQAQLDDVLRDPEGTRQAEEAFDRELEETGTLGARIRAFEKNRRAAEGLDPEPKPKDVTIRTPGGGKKRRHRRRGPPL